jgi:integrase/recombinase XerC
VLSEYERLVGTLVPQRPVKHRRPRPAVTGTPKDDSLTWEKAVRSFLADCRRRNLAPATTDTYSSMLMNVRTQQFRKDHGVTTPAALTSKQLRTFETELTDAGLSSQSIIGYHRVLKTFAAFCIREGYGVEESVLDVVGPKREQREPEVFSAADEKRLLEAAGNERDRLLVEFMLATGLRLQEVARVTIDDIVDSPDGAYIRVRQGKGRKDRIVPLDTPRNRLSRKLLRYAERSRASDAEERTLFLSTHGGHHGTGSPLTTRGIQITLRRLGEKANIHVHPHKFRHTFATRALSAGVDVMALQRALGHTTLAMVSRYVHYQKDDLLDAWRRRRD